MQQMCLSRIKLEALSYGQNSVRILKEIMAIDS